MTSKKFLCLLLLCTTCLCASDWELLNTKGTPAPRNESALIEDDGLFYLIGGRGKDKPVSIFNPANRSWRNASTPPIEVHHLQPVQYGDKIYIIGAMTGKFPNETGLDKVLIYDPEKDNWSWGHEIPEERRRGAAGVVNVDGHIYVVGGIVRGHVGGYVDWLDRYDPATGEWIVLKDAPHQRDHFQAAYLDGKIYAAGGRRTSKETNQIFELTVPEVDVYDIATDTWSVLKEPLPTPRAGSMTLALEQEVMVLGGESAQKMAHAEVEAWDVHEGCWHHYPPMQQGRHGTGAVLYENYVYTCAGTGQRGGKPNLTTTERLSLEGLEFTNEKGSSINLSANAKTAKPVAGNKTATLHGKRMPDGDGSVAFSGELKQWHNVILTLDGPFAHELDTQPNPFIDRQMNVIFTHESGQPSYRVPAYFAADGNAAESSAESGIKWRAHLSPDKTGTWNYRIDFKGTEYDGSSGSFVVGPSDKSGRDLRAKGRLQYVGKRYLQFADSGEWFIKFGADAPETFLAYKDFDNTVANNPKKSKLKSWKPHLQDWAPGDPTWKDGKGKGMIGAINYLASTGANVFSFLTYNAGGDGDNIWPHVSRSDKLHFDCSKLDQWGIVFSHATAKGMYLHFKLQETENDDLRGKSNAGKEQALDQGKLGIERKAYLREMIARYGHNLALNWNIGEENTQTHEEIVDQARYIRELDPYQHLLVLHTYPNQQQKVYGSLLGQADLLTGLSIQNSNVAHCHENVLNWVGQSKESGHNWVVAIDEPGNASTGTPPDPDYPGMQKVFDTLNSTMQVPTLDEIRSQVIWGSLMGGGAGVEFYFGYQLPQNDLNAEDWRSRAQTWEYSRIAMEFFQNGDIPFTEMSNANALVGNSKNSNERYCFAKPNELYLVYLSKATTVQLDLSEAEGDYSVQWFNPRTGGALKTGTVKTVQAGSKVDLGAAPVNPEADWLLVVRRK